MRAIRMPSAAHGSFLLPRLPPFARRRRRGEQVLPIVIDGDT